MLDGHISKGSRTLLQRKEVELQTLLVQCQKRDKKFREIFSEHVEKEGFEKEGGSQFAYEERVAMTLSTAKRFLEEEGRATVSIWVRHRFRGRR